MATGHFGLDSAADARTYYPQAVTAFGSPAFIGRYLPIYAITPAERDYIHGQGVAILPLWNHDQNGVNIRSASVAVGRAEASEACIQWGALGLPKGRVIVYDVEAGMFLSPTALQGWIEGCHAAGYVAGVYLNPPGGNNHSVGYQQARAATQGLPCVHFTSQYELFANNGVPQHEFLVDAQHAAAVPGYEAECVFWQSYENNLGGIVDLDVCTDAGLTFLWHPAPVAPPTPPTYRTRLRVALKAQANHGPDLAIDEHDRPVMLELGAVVVPVSTVTTAGELWRGVTIPGTKIHGYLLARDIVVDAV
jgi:hypothetical protein